MSLKKVSFLFLFSLFFSGKNILHAQLKISDEALFTKCHLMFIKSVVPKTSSLGQNLLDKIKNKQITGSEACILLIKQVDFFVNGKKTSELNLPLPALTDAEQKQIISTFHNFHNSWFTQKSFKFGNDSNLILRDNDEPSLYFTKALFANNVDLSSVFTSQETLRGFRETSFESKSARWKDKPFDAHFQNVYGSDLGFLLSYGVDESVFTLPIPDAQLVPFGRLKGTENVPSFIVPEVYVYKPQNVSLEFKNKINDELDLKKKNINLFENFGGGILGSQVFIMKNTNLSLYQLSGGIENSIESVMPRRISSRVFENLLCQQIPTLMPDDVSNDIIPDSKLMFRRSVSCMQCHSSLDTFASVYRNLVPYLTSTNIFSNDVSLQKKGTSINGLTAFTPSKNLNEPVPIQQPSGYLNYRDHQNNLIKKNVNNIHEMGLLLAESPDFYRCVAKRYYQFLTGYNVELSQKIYSFNDTNLAKVHREKVYQIAEHLKKHQSLVKMIDEIINSPAFSTRANNIETEKREIK